MKAEGRMAKDEWKTVALGDVAEFVRGINFKPDDVVPTGTPGTVACMRTKNVQAELDMSDVWSVGEQFVRREDQFLQTGDVLVSSANSWNLVGKCCWIPELPGRASFGGFVSVLRPHRAKVEPRFLFRWFSSDRIQTTLRSFGQQTTNISNLNTDRCLKLPLPLPPLAEQRRIAEVLDRAEALRAKRRAALAQLASLTQSLFLDLFGDPATNPKGWPKKSLGEVAREKPNNGIFRKNPEYIQDGKGGLPVVWLEEIFRGDSIDTKESRRVIPDGADVEKYGLKTGDILFCRSSLKLDGIAFNNVYLGNDDEALFECHVIRISPDLKIISPVFLNSLLRLPQMRAIAKSKSKTATMTTIDQQSLCSIELPLPPVKIQHEFAGRIRAVEKLKVAHRASLAELDALFATLQNRAFKGEL